MSALYVPFADLFEFLPKSKRKAGDGQSIGQYPFYTSSQVTVKRTDESDYEPDALVFGTGGSASVHHAVEPFSTSGDCLVAVARDRDNTNTRAYYHYLTSNIHLIEEGFRGAGLKHVSKVFLSELPVPKIGYDEQNHIAQILDKSDVIRRKRQQAIQLADEFIRSVFLDMFNDSEALAGNWSLVKIEDLLASVPNAMRTGPFGSQLRHSEFTQCGVPVLGIDNIVTNKFRWTVPRCLPEDRFQDFVRYQVRPGDVIVTIMGTTGRVAVAPEDIPTCMSTKHLCVITLDQTKVDPYFLWATLVFDQRVRQQAKVSSGGAIMEGWNMGIIKELTFRLPPPSLQKDFRCILEKVQCDQVAKNMAAVESNNLLNSLSNHAFRGDL
jgi:type I restriction enzyme S subunit